MMKTIRPADAPSAAMARRPDAPDIGNFSRRGFLGAAAGGAAIAGLAGTAGAEPAPEALDRVQPTWFTAAEWPLVLALCDTLIPGGADGPGALDARVPIFLDRLLGGPWGGGERWYMAGPHQPDADPLLGFQSPLTPAGIWRGGMTHFDGWCTGTRGDGFVALSAPDRHEAMAALQDGKTALPPDLRDFPDLLLENVKQGYLSDPRHGGNHGMVGWSHVGFPGARGNFLSWTDPARDGTPYPLGPVSIAGERG